MPFSCKRRSHRDTDLFVARHWDLVVDFLAPLGSPDLRVKPSAARNLYDRLRRSGAFQIGEDGQWRTSGAKEYPPRMCRAMVTAVAEEVRRRLTTGDCRFVPLSTILAHLLQWAVELERKSAAIRGVHRPDYQGWTE